MYVILCHVFCYVYVTSLWSEPQTHQQQQQQQQIIITVTIIIIY